MNVTTRIKIGLVGAGTMGALHARVISESQRATLAWVADPDRSSGSALAMRHATEWIPTMDPSRVDAVIIAAATEAHPALAIEVLEEGKPLLVEKPIADQLSDSRRIVELSGQRGVPLMCGFLERYNPALLTAVEFIDSPISAASVRHSPYVARIRTGVASDLLIHDLDVMVRLFGSQPVDVTGRLARYNEQSLSSAEDVADAILRFPGGQLATSSASRMSQRKIRTLVITELDRQIELDLVRSDITVYRHVGNAAADELTGLGYRQQTVIDIPFIRHQREPLAAQLDRFLDMVDGQGDADLERESLLAPHELLDLVRASSGQV